MKKLLTLTISIIIALSIISCSGKSESPSPIITDPYVPPVIVNPIEPIIASVAFYDGTDTYFYDGTVIVKWKTGRAEVTGYRKIAVDDVLYTLDQNAQIQTEKNILSDYNLIVTDADNNVWQTKTIDPVTAYNAGAPARNHTKILYNGAEFGDWMTRQYITRSIQNVNGDIIILGDSGGYRHLNGTKTGIQAIYNDILMHDFDGNTRIGMLNGKPFATSFNFISNAKEWLKSGSKWYSMNGYTFDGNTVSENASALWCWNYQAQYPITIPENAVVIAAGTRVEAGEAVIYFIECNTGWVFRYVPSLNTMSQKVRLYNGNGLRATGIYYAAIMKPIVTDDGLYFIFDDGALYRYNFQSMTTGYVAMADWVVKW